MAKNTTTLNKFLTGSVTAAMVATAIVPVAAANDTAADTIYSDVSADSTHYENILEARTLELLSGYTDGTFKPGAKLTRSNVVKALGKYVIAKSGKEIQDFDVTGVTPFNDVTAEHPDKELYNYSLIVKKAGVFSGSNNNLMPTNLISRQQMAKVAVNAFGLKDLPGDLSKVTDNNKAFAEFVPFINILSENGVTTESTFRPTETVQRDQFASFLVRAYEIANPVVVAPEVVEVSAINAKEVQVKFSQPVAKETVLNGSNVINITLDEVGTAVDAGPLTGSLSADGKTLTITATNTFDGSYTVVATDDIEATDGTAIPEYKEVVTFEDTTRPTVGAASYLTNNVATFTFSEPVNVAGNAALADALTLKNASGATYTPVVSLAADKKSFTVDLNGAAFSTGVTYNLTVTSLTDYAGNLISPNPTTLSVEKKSVDTVLPTVSTISSNQAGYVVVNFSEKIAAQGSSVIATVGGVSADLATNASLDASGTVLTVRAASYTGTKDITVTGFYDVAGNLGTPKTSLVTFPVDTVKPTVSSNAVKAIDGKNYLVLTFSEDVTVTNAATTDITGTYVTENGVEKTVTAIDDTATNVSPVAGTKNQVKVLIDSQEKGNYLVSLPANLVTDVVGNANVATSATYSVGANVSETTKPTVYDATPTTADLDGIVVQVADKNTVTIRFSEPVATSSLNLNNFLVEGATVAERAVFTTTDQDTIKLTLKEAAINTSGTYNFTVKNVSDLAGNVMNAVTTQKAFFDNNLPGLTSAALTSNDTVNGSATITLTFDEAIAAGSIVDNTVDFDVFVDGVALNLSTSTLTEAMSATSTNKVTLTLDRALTAAESSKALTVKPSTGFAVTDLAGNAHPSFTSVTVSK